MSPHGVLTVRVKAWCWFKVVASVSSKLGDPYRAHEFLLRRCVLTCVPCLFFDPCPFCMAGVSLSGHFAVRNVGLRGSCRTSDTLFFCGKRNIWIWTMFWKARESLVLRNWRRVCFGAWSSLWASAKLQMPQAHLRGRRSTSETRKKGPETQVKYGKTSCSWCAHCMVRF